MIEPLMSRQPERRIATPSQTVGPFFHFGLARDLTLGTMAGEGAQGERIRLRIRVTDGDGNPVPDALLELWQADSEGRYVRPAEPSQAAPVNVSFTGFGRLPTSTDGVCLFDTIRPGIVRNPDDRYQAAHIDVCLFSRGLLRQVYTRIYFEGDADLDRDAVLALVPAERRQTLLATRSPDAAGEWRFDLRLQGTGETVFFDL
jgi:protocatechuate 3,4-dioxygenase alpha subunit